MIGKLLGWIVSPLHVTLFAGFAGLLCIRAGRRRCGMAAICAAFGILWLCSLPLFSDALTGALERRYAPVLPSASLSAQAIVVLGGCVGAAAPPRLSSDLVDASDRVLHAARLFRAGKAPIVLVSGGNLPATSETVPEAEEMANLLIEWGVPAEAVILDGRSISTRENALFSKTELNRVGVKRVLLVTSALHMVRAVGAYRAVGFEVVPSPTDFHVTRDPGKPWWSGLWPSEGALSTTSAAVHEYAGLIYYRLRRWIA